MSRYDSRTLAAIHEALDDEYKARATYEAVITRFGPVQPFTNIIGAEERHANALERLLQRAGEPIPADPWRGAIDSPDTLADALALGVQAEIDNRNLYDRLETMTGEPEVLRVFANLRRASQNNHLPAFQRRLDRLMGSGSGDVSGEPMASTGGRHTAHTDSFSPRSGRWARQGAGAGTERSATAASSLGRGARLGGSGGGGRGACQGRGAHWR